MAFGSSGRDAKKAQQDFFANMQTIFLGKEDGGDGGDDKSIVGQLKAAADDLRSASDMLRQSSSAQPSYGGANGMRPTMSGDQTRRPKPHDDYSLDPGYSSYGALRRGIAGEIAARYGSGGGAFSRGNTFNAHYDKHGTIDYYNEVDPRGNFVGEHAHNSPEAQQVFARQQRAAGLRDLANTPSPFYTGSGNGPVHTPGVTTAQHVVNATIGKIPVVGGIIAGVVGGILGAPDAVMNGIVNQRAANAQYQSILGGTNWGTGVHNRMLEEGFKLSQLYSGGLTGAMSTEAFRGVTSLGYTGELRDKSLGMITSNYKNLGMSVGESMKFLSTMAQTSSTAFDALKASLTEVSNAARNTGLNLDTARAGLLNLQTIGAQTTGGAGVGQNAGIVSVFQNQLGRNFQNVNFSQMLPGVNPGITALQASSVGMSMSEYEMTVADGGAKGRDLFVKAGDNLMAMAVAPEASMAKPIINKLLQAHGGLATVTSSNEALTAFLKEAAPALDASGINIMGLKQRYFSYTGAVLTDQQAKEMVIRGVLGVGSSFSAADKQSKAAMSQTKKRVFDAGGTTGGGTPGKVASGHYIPNKVTAHTPSHIVTTDPLLDQFKKYANQGTHVVVDTKDGPKVVSGEYAFAHMQDQIAKGTAKFLGGENDGQSVAEALGQGGYGEANYKGVNTTKVSGADAKHFQAVDDYNRKHPNKNGNGGTVIIAPNPALAQLLNITATGNVTVANEGAQYGSVPKPGQFGLNLNGP